MALLIAQPFKRAGGFPIDESFLLSKAEMLLVNDDHMPDKYFAICQDDGEIYLYNKENDIDTVTGKFRILEGGGGTGDYELLINQPKINGVTLMSDKTGEDLNLQDKMAEITDSEIDTIIYG